MSLDQCRIVLVRPHIASNVGATARIMRNMGLTRLVLVAPVCDPVAREARQLSTHGEWILDQAQVVASLAEAIGECVEVACTSARPGRLIRGGAEAPKEVMPGLAAAARLGPTALVFGPEPNGLLNEEIGQCQHLIHIPADDAYPALNLAQAVAICLYELRLAYLADSQLGVGKPAPATVAEQAQMFEHLQDALERIHFLYGEKADTLMHGLRQLLRRARLSPTEVGILHGLARQILWYVSRYGPDRQIQDRQQGEPAS